MSCQEFESVMTELARGALMDASARAAAESHARECEACAAALRRGRALTSALGEVREAMRDIEAPARVEAALLARLRERRDAAKDTNTVGAGGAAASSIPVSTPRSPVLSPRFGTNVRRSFVVAAVAASLVLALFVAWRAVSRRERARDVESAARRGAQQPTAGGAREGAKPPDQSQTGEQSRRLTGGENKPREAVAVVAERSTKSRAPRPESKRGARDPLEALPVAFVEDGGRVVADGGAGAVASDFVPLVTADAGAPLDGGRMVRVEVPRAALAALGLPVSGERADETVKADLLLAHDGTARAIRLLR